MDALEISLLVGGGLAAGVVNTLAGGGSLLTVPLLVLLGLPAGVANGTNRIGILLQSASASWRFRAQGVASLRDDALRVVAPVALGALLGAVLISRASDAFFARVFGALMLLLLLPTLRRPRAPQLRPERRALAPWLERGLFFGAGLYAGAFQAGVGLLLVLLLSWAGHDLVRATALKVAAVLVTAVVSVPVFVAAGQVAWAPALLLGAGFATGGELGARLAVRGGERLIRPVLAAAVLALAGHMLGLY